MLAAARKQSQGWWSPITWYSLIPKLPCSLRLPLLQLLVFPQPATAAAAPMVLLRIQAAAPLTSLTASWSLPKVFFSLIRRRVVAAATMPSPVRHELLGKTWAFKLQTNVFVKSSEAEIDCQRRESDWSSPCDMWHLEILAILSLSRLRLRSFVARCASKSVSSENTTLARGFEPTTGAGTGYQFDLPTN